MRTVAPPTERVCQRCLDPWETDYVTPRSTHGLCERCSGMAAYDVHVDARLPRPMFGSVGPFASTCTALDIHPRIIWDVNRWYADLGVDPRASRDELRRVYQQRKGWLSHRLTYIMKMLLQPDVRSDYDQVPPGQFYMDLYLRRAIQARLQDSRIAASDARDMGSDGTTADDSTADWWEDLEGEEISVDGVDVVVHDRDTDSGLIRGMLWSVWQCQTDHYDEVRAKRWLWLLVRAASVARETIRVAVGFHGGIETMSHQALGPGTVFFLAPGVEPTPEMATTAIRETIHTGDK